MTRRTTTAILVLLLFAPGILGQTARRIEEINKLRAKIDQDIARSEAEPEYSNIYLTELAVNKNNGSYPAVGIYRPVARFYYTYGDREKEPYPNRLLKIIVAVDRSDRKEYSEFVFNDAEQLVFYLGRMEDIERRLYFVAQRPIRLEENGKLVNMRTRSRAATVAPVLKERTNLVAIFRRSLEF
ncbi:MAG TPA: hypothetical protein VFZ40_07685 [Pyrinomonadaceae bacterium]